MEAASVIRDPRALAPRHRWLTEVNTRSSVRRAMDRRLQTDSIRRAMAAKGLSPADLARHLEVSRAAVTHWLKGSKLPRPAKLIRLGILLDLTFDALVQPLPTAVAPVVAFRRKGNHKIDQRYISRAVRMGELLEGLVPHLPFDPLFAPETLKDPATDLEYLETVAQSVRQRAGLPPAGQIELRQVFHLLRKWQAVVVPVLWGAREKHENALHVLLPRSRVTWIYLNLDTPTQHFRFWIAHELGHVLTPDLCGSDEGEDFADSFAGALLFPLEAVIAADAHLRRAHTVTARIAHVLELAKAHGIAPYTIHRRLDAYAAASDQERIDLGSNHYAAFKRFEQQDQTIAHALFGADPVAPAEFMQRTSDSFETPFWDALRAHAAQTQAPVAFLQGVLDLPALDAKNLHLALF